MKPIKREFGLMVFAILGVIAVFGKLLLGAARTDVLVTTLGVVVALVVGALLMSALGALIERVCRLEPCVIRKRLTSCMAMLCAVAILVGSSPMALAAEAVTADNAEGDSALLVHLRQEIADYIEANGISVEMTDDELLDAFFSLDDEGCEAALTDAEALYEEAQALSEEEAARLGEEANTKLCLRYYGVISDLSAPALFAVTNGTDFTPVEGIAVHIDNANNSSGNPAADSFDDETGKISVCVSSDYETSGSGCNSTTTYTPKTDTVTITNITEKDVYISFDWARSNSATVTVGGAAVSAESGSVKEKFTPNATYILTVQSDNSTNNIYLYLSNFVIEEAKTVNKVTVEFPEGNTVSVGGTAIESGEVFDVTDSLTVSASAANFLAWVNSSNDVVGNDPTITYVPKGDTTLRALYSTVALFKVGDKMFDDLNAAVTYAESATSKVVTLMNDATLAAGGYNIPAGITLLIPFDDAGTFYTTEPGNDGGSTWSQPEKFRELTLSEGTSITVEGAISLSAKHHAGGASDKAGSPTGKVSFLQMEEGSSITVKKGGALYAWGYITGAGTITAESEAVVYENFQINDFRGGSHTAWIAKLGGKDTGVFPFNSYFVQNIEVLLTINAGAALTCYTSVYAQGSSHASPLPFIANSNAMFNLTQGTLVKDYDEVNDRLIITVNGDMSVSPLSLEIAGNSFNSSGYNMPINSNITVDILSGTVTVAQHLAILPSATVNIAEGTNLVLGEGVKVFIYDLDDWKTTYTYSPGVKYRALAYAPGRQNTLTDEKLTDATICVNGTIDATAGYVYTTTGGANIYSTGDGVVKTIADTETTSTKQVTALATNYGFTAGTTEDVTVAPATLRNADGSYTSTAAATEATTYNYSKAHGKWVAGGHTDADSKVTSPTCTDAGYTTYTCSCGYTYKGNEVAANGHTFETTAAVEATCEKAGNEAYNQCTVCKLYFAADAENTSTEGVADATGFVIPQKDHSYTGAIKSDGNGKDATHSFLCVNGCNKYGDAVTHTWNEGVIDPDSTCTGEGVKTYTCTADGCGATYTEGVAAKGHAFGDVVAAKEETCLEAGNVAYKQCTVCNLYFAATAEANATDGKTDNSSFVIAKLAHAYTGEIRSDGNDRSATHSFKCVNGCDQYGDAVTHTWNEGVAETEATFEAAGTRKYTCTVEGCGATYTEEIPQKSAVASVKVGSEVVKFETLAEALSYASTNSIKVITLQAEITDAQTVGQPVAIYKNGFTAVLTAADGYVLTDRSDAYIIAQDVENVTYSSNLLSAEGKVVLQLKFFVPERYLTDETVTVTWTEEANSQEEAVTTTWTMEQLMASGIDDSGRYTLKQDIASGEMTGDITVVFRQGEETLPIYDKSGVEIEQPFVRTVLDYSRDALTKGSEKMKELSRMMLTYGGYAQINYDIDADNPAYSIFSEVGVDMPDIETYVNYESYGVHVFEASLGEIGITKYSQKVLLDSDVTLVGYFTLEEGADISDYTFTLTYVEAGTDKTKTVTPVLEDGRYRVEIENIPVAYWDYRYKITVTNSAAEGNAVITTGVLTWARQCIEKSTNVNLINVAKAMFLYNGAANEYYGK